MDQTPKVTPKSQFSSRLWKRNACKSAKGNQKAKTWTCSSLASKLSKAMPSANWKSKRTATYPWSISEKRPPQKTQIIQEFANINCWFWVPGVIFQVLEKRPRRQRFWHNLCWPFHKAPQIYGVLKSCFQRLYKYAQQRVPYVLIAWWYTYTCIHVVYKPSTCPCFNLQNFNFGDFADEVQGSIFYKNRTWQGAQVSEPLKEKPK